MSMQSRSKLRAEPHEGQAKCNFFVANARSIPLPIGSIDVVFSHALFEHLSAPLEVLAEMRRVLRPGGTLAISSSDWQGATLDPHSADVRMALQAHFELRRRAGGDPFAGGKLAEWALAAGFSDVRSGADDKVDMTYAELGRYIASLIREGIEGSGSDDVLSHEALDAAERWAAHTGPGAATQRWVHVLARR
jgi:SAM-dependent methyltransferase